MVTRNCDVCQQEIPDGQAKFVEIRMCCKLERIPLCSECHEKHIKR